MKKITLIIEKGSDEELWGRVDYDDNLITGNAPTLDLLQKRIRGVLNKLHGQDSNQVEFDLVYDLTAVFSEKKYLNLSEVALKLGINRSLMAQYAAGKKFPSLQRAGEIEKAIHDLGRDLLKVKIAIKGVRAKKKS
ncbi:MAG TPA: helix-turn-helix transcriptional regulator [Puia sp.]|nr:helix-turn-helix transcriptional regulator [Puia sp.]